MRRIVLNIHLCAGMIAALFLMSQSLSGAIIAFENELNRTFHPQLTNVKPDGQALNWDAFRDRVQQQSPGWKLIRFYFPERPDRSTYVRLRSSTTHRIRHVYVNQYTGIVLGSTEDGNNWILKVHDLHVNLLSGKIGNRIVTWSTFGLLLLSFSESSCGGRVRYSAFNEHPPCHASIAICITPSASGPFLQCLPSRLLGLPFTTRRASYLAS
jgi:uncharacterized iron-regulated membrane protein